MDLGVPEFGSALNFICVEIGTVASPLIWVSWSDIGGGVGVVLARDR